MILPIHILVALGGILSAGFLYVNPSKAKFHTTYALVALTIVTGFYLIVAKPVRIHMAQVCVTGLIYLGGMAFAIISARRKLLAQRAP